jgi:acyl-CoA synthetase (AMP-forming)/AMP-acid ligase II
LPLYTAHGWVAGVLMPLCSGGEVLLLDDQMEQDLILAAHRHRARTLALMPPSLHALVEQAQAHAQRLPESLVVGSAGVQLSSALVSLCQEVLGRAPCQGYGLAETLPVVAQVQKEHKAGALGRALLPTVQVRIIDETGDAVPTGQTGEIVITGPTVTSGFIRRKAESDRFVRGGAFRTGDLGYVDADGYLYFVGRRLPLSKVWAQVVDLTEVESVVLQHPSIERARATVRPEPGQGRQLTVSVSLKPGAAVTNEELLSLCRENLSHHKVPKRFKVCPARVGATAHEAA